MWHRSLSRRRACGIIWAVVLSPARARCGNNWLRGALDFQLVGSNEILEVADASY